ncbi:iron-sulfur cluster assembly scaffold protein [Natranaerofaba carboxydovora]|uniref:iron-sulfur cluster assembly scaffold protein n=1 Tax=Natranaerofaba carboxydovora TaxID=2742683 RepID=UPI001F12C61E|nr:iron-sulfur cluster assembly scaffold protein [Natranaerofaba carboxydovora]UMZ75472.1 Iron-sulfur cluster assembly scaffold protein IscU [Natranaerofaba carboxydovora]
MYSEKVIEHFSNPRNAGSIDIPDGVAAIGDPSCGDFLRIYIKVKDNCIDDIKFEVFGCPAAIATSSITTELAKGKKLNEALLISSKNIIDSLGGLPKPKLHCSILGAKALHEAIKDYLKQSNKMVT